MSENTLGRAPGAHQPDKHSTPPEIQILDRRFRSCREDIGRRVADARASSEDAVVAIGHCINGIVDEAKTYVAEIERQRKIREECEAQTQSMVQDMVASVQRQEETVEHAMAQSSAILRAGRDVQAMASATRLLSLNARVEASRLGDQGSSFSVIADEMRQLSLAVQKTNTEVSGMAKELERLLPQIGEQIKDMHRQFEEFAEHVEKRLNVGGSDAEPSDGGPVVERIVAAAYRALSHLAFQDPMIQSLEQIHGSLDRVETHIKHLTSDDVDVELPPEPPADEGDTMSSGEMMLF